MTFFTVTLILFRFELEKRHVEQIVAVAGDFKLKGQKKRHNLPDVVNENFSMEEFINELYEEPTPGENIVHFVLS